jgi:hypothetical protein
LSARPDQLYPNTDAGRADLLAYLVEKNRAIRARMPEVFRTLPADPMDIVRVPPEIEDGAPGGYAQSGSLDGKRPGRFYIHLKNTAEWPRFGLDTLVYHEAIPGHLWHGAQLRAFGDIPMLRRSISFAAYNEGWAHYSEQLADELGMYEGNPLGASAISRRCCSGRCGWWSIPGCTPSAGAGARRSTTSSARRLPRRPGPARSRPLCRLARAGPAPTRSGTTSGSACVISPRAAPAPRSTPRTSTTCCAPGIMPLVLLAQLVEARFPPRPGAPSPVPSDRRASSRAPVMPRLVAERGATM